MLLSWFAFGLWHLQKARNKRVFNDVQAAPFLVINKMLLGIMLILEESGPAAITIPRSYLNVNLCWRLFCHVAQNRVSLHTGLGRFFLDEKVRARKAECRMKRGT